ncbi:MAG: hypothetical protein HYY18_20665 [Planctomycetes bacterium]|nr:hypothetical protein [Planctomycetota bacterium]
MRLRAAALLLALAAVPFLPPASGEGEDFPWMTDIDAARQKARDEGRPLLIVFR